MSRDNKDKEKYMTGCAVPPRKEQIKHPAICEYWVWSDSDVLGTITLPFGMEMPDVIIIGGIEYRREKC